MVEPHQSNNICGICGDIDGGKQEENFSLWLNPTNRIIYAAYVATSMVENKRRTLVVNVNNSDDKYSTLHKDKKSRKKPKKTLDIGTQV